MSLPMQTVPTTYLQGGGRLPEDQNRWCDPLPAALLGGGLMDKEQLAERLTTLQKQREQAIANANALNGAIQECQFWIAKLEEAEKKSLKPEEN